MLFRPLILEVLCEDEHGEALEEMGIQPDLREAPTMIMEIWSVNYVMEDIRSTRELPITCIATGDQIFMALIPIEKVRQKLMQCAKTPFV